MICSPDALAGPYTFPSSKVAALSLVKLFLRTGRLEEAFDLPKIDSAEFGFALPRGRADLVLLHVERSATVVKLKGPGGRRHLSAGIPQVICQAAQIRKLYDVRGVRTVLAATVAGEPNRDIASLCHLCGVHFVPLGTPAEHMATYESAGLLAKLGASHAAR
jgi:hypothetical protein